MSLSGFNPDQWAEQNGKLFGLPFEADEAALVVIPSPWDVTVSYRDGTARGPEAILQASYQVDLLDPVSGMAWKKGLAMADTDPVWKKTGKEKRKVAIAYLDHLTSGKGENTTNQKRRDELNAACDHFHRYIYEQSSAWLEKGKTVAILGGDHSSPFGLMKALSERHSEWGVLQIDAHADLRKAFEGFTWSHASIMYNALTRLPAIKKLVQVGIRDYCGEEMEYIRNSGGRVKTFFDTDIKQKLYEGEPLKKIWEDVIAALPQKVYISFDVDGLDPKLCPQTGTPVPGGFEFEETMLLIKMVLDSGRDIIGFDICETADPGFEKKGNDSFDAIVGARLLFRIANMILAGKTNVRS